MFRGIFKVLVHLSEIPFAAHIICIQGSWGEDVAIGFQTLDSKLDWPSITCVFGWSILTVHWIWLLTRSFGFKGRHRVVNGTVLIVEYVKYYIIARAFKNSAFSCFHGQNIQIW